MPEPAVSYLTPVVLTGNTVRLEPLAERHVPDLARVACDDEVWRWLPAHTPRHAADLAALVRAAQLDQERGTRVPFAIVQLATDRAVGSTSYLEIAPEHRRIEIGWTWLGRPVWRTAVNTEAKLLLLTRAFEVLGARRVALRTDLMNTRSQQAIERLGAQREGVLRSHMVRVDGSCRDSVYYSVLDREWPAVRARLQARLQQGS